MALCLHTTLQGLADQLYGHWRLSVTFDHLYQGLHQYTEPLTGLIHQSSRGPRQAQYTPCVSIHFMTRTDTIISRQDACDDNKKTNQFKMGESVGHLL